MVTGGGPARGEQAGRGGTLRRWWRTLWPAARPDAGGADAPPAASAEGGAALDADRRDARRPTLRRDLIAPPRDDDPQREAHLGSVLQALAGGPLTRDRLADRVGAASWGPGRLDAVVAHGVASGVLLTGEGDGGGTVRARYAD